MIVKFRSGSYVPKGVDPEEAEARLTQICARDGAITDEAVLADAQMADSPLRNAFEWDAEKVVRQYHLQQARNLIGSLIIVVQSPDFEPVEARRFVLTRASTEDQSGARYIRIEQTMNDEELRNEQIRQATLEFQKWQRRWQWLGNAVQQAIVGDEMRMPVFARQTADSDHAVP